MTTLQSTYMYLKTMGYDFDVKIQKMKNMIMDTNTEVLKCQSRINTQVGHSNGKITHHAATKICEIMDTAQAYTNTFKENVTSVLTEYTEKYRQHVASITETQMGKIKEMCANMEGDLENLASDAVKKIRMEIDNHTKDAAKPQLPQVTNPEPAVQQTTPDITLTQSKTQC
jgi:hypothetical protein